MCTCGVAVVQQYYAVAVIMQIIIIILLKAAKHKEVGIIVQTSKIMGIIILLCTPLLFQKKQKLVFVQTQKGH